MAETDSVTFTVEDPTRGIHAGEDILLGGTGIGNRSMSGSHDA